MAARQDQAHAPLCDALASHGLDGTLVHGLAPRHVWRRGAWLPWDDPPHTLNNSDCCLDAILVKPITAPRAAEPYPPLPLNLGEPALRLAALVSKHGVRELQLTHCKARLRPLRGVQGDKQVSGTLRQALQRVDPVRHAHGFVAGARLVEVRKVEAVPRRPHLAVLGHQSRVAVQVHVVQGVRHPLKHLALRLAGGDPQDLERDVGVGREHHIVKLFRLAGGSLESHALRCSLHRSNCRLAASVAQPVNHRLDVRPAPSLDNPPLGTNQDVEEVVVDPEAHKHLDGKLEALLVADAPYSSTHGQQIVVGEGLAVLVLGEIALKVHILVGVVVEHLGRLLAEPKHFTDHVEKRW
mmetsp:Transcript_25158/g.48995  ORF Transcript_25158/g.48995 Transcript_25158/m.48995 type:complete len:353 (-) Transcript_25158:311-1369(-)